MAFLPPSSFPVLNASLNAACTVFLLFGFNFIRQRKIFAHRVCMVTAFFCSVVFLVAYLYFHFHAGLIRFGGQGWIRPVYFTLLISHTTLAVVTLPLVVITLSFAIREKSSSHRRIARWTHPIWLCVSVTGVVIYRFLCIDYTPIGAPA
jgi:putative membrane protein